MKRIAFPALGLFVLWLALSGQYKVLVVALGAISSIGVSALASRFGVLSPNLRAFPFFVRSAFYLPWLTKEAIVSALSVVRAIWTPGLAIQPQIVHAKATQRTPLGLATHANSITVTPGTLSMDADTPGEIKVHALLDTAAEGVADGEMDRRVTALEGKPR